ncbi:MAG: L-threonylcarbamoyladenylate synthase [Pseudomonadota bacterium]
MANVIEIDVVSATYRDVAPIAEILLGGGVAVGPTETSYGLMAAADQPEAMERIMKLKGRDGNKPLLLLLDRPERALCYAREIPQCVTGLTAEFWPGPLTLLLRSRPGLYPSLVGPTRTVGLRVAGAPALRLLARVMDRAITGTSANPGGLPPARSLGQALDYFGDKIDLYIDGGPSPKAPASTIIDASLGPPRLVRDGGLSINQMIKAAPDMRT